MDARRRHAASRRMGRVEAPVVGVERQELVVAEVGLDLQDAAEPARIDVGQELGHRRLEAALVPHAEHEAGVAAEVHEALRRRPASGPAASRRRRACRPPPRRDLLVVQRVGRGQHHGLDVRIAPALRRGRPRAACRAPPRRAAPRPCWARPSGRSARRRCALDHVDHLAAPPAEADHREIDHLHHPLGCDQEPRAARESAVAGGDRHRSAKAADHAARNERDEAPCHPSCPSSRSIAPLRLGGQKPFGFPQACRP